MPHYNLTILFIAIFLLNASLSLVNYDSMQHVLQILAVVILAKAVAI